MPIEAKVRDILKLQFSFEILGGVRIAETAKALTHFNSPLRSSRKHRHHAYEQPQMHYFNSPLRSSVEAFRVASRVVNATSILL